MEFLGAESCRWNQQENRYIFSAPVGTFKKPVQQEAICIFLATIDLKVI